eukprot:2463980-Pyramimonas_sp.AAC.1
MAKDKSNVFEAWLEAGEDWGKTAQIITKRETTSLTEASKDYAPMKLKELEELYGVAGAKEVTEICKKNGHFEKGAYFPNQEKYNT